MGIKYVECECGCGQEVKTGKRFIRGHNKRGTTMSDDTKDLVRKTLAETRAINKSISLGIKLK